MVLRYITYRLPVGQSLLCKRPIKEMFKSIIPESLRGAHPLTKKLEDYGFEIESHQITKFHCENRFKWRADQDRDIFHRRVFRGWP